MPTYLHNWIYVLTVIYKYKNFFFNVRNLLEIFLSGLERLYIIDKRNMQHIDSHQSGPCSPSSHTADTYSTSAAGVCGVKFLHKQASSCDGVRY